MKKISILYLATFCLTLASADFMEEVTDFVSCNADKKIELVNFANQRKFSLQLKKSLTKVAFVKTSFVNLTSKRVFPSDEEWKPPPFTIILADTASVSLAISYLVDQAYNTTIKSFLLLMTSWNNNSLSVVKESVKAKNQSVLFYITYETRKDHVDTIMVWQQIVSIKNRDHIVVNNLKFQGKF
jgi:hypothetical protein